MGDAARWMDEAGLDIRGRGEVFEVDLPVRWGDMDAQGHVNNALYLDYLQDARADFLISAGLPGMLTNGVVVASHRVEYRAPITYSAQPVQVLMVLLERRMVRFRLGYLIIHDGVLCAVASSTMSPFDLASQRPCRIPAEEAALFDRHLWQVEHFFEPLPQPALAGRGHRSDLLTRWSDVDTYRHVNNVRTLDFFQEGRIAMTTAADPRAARAGSAGSSEGRSQWLVARQDVEYLQQMSFRRSPYPVYTAVTAIGTTSLKLAAEIVDPLRGEVLSRAQHVLVRADGNGRPLPIPDGMREGLRQFMAE